MSMTSHAPVRVVPVSPFERVVCGVDGSECARVAAAQAAALVEASGSLHLVSVVESEVLSPYAFAGPLLIQEAQGRAESILAEELRRHPRATAGTAFGAAAGALASAAREHDATLVAVGAHGGGRLAGIVLGSAVTGLLHDSPCSVLVARATSVPDEFPRSILVGTDGSPAALAAVGVAKRLAARVDARLRILAASGGDPVDLDALASEGLLEWSALTPVEALTQAARSFDLLVVGSRGLRGLHALGSVSERVGHESPSSVLVVKATARDPDGELPSAA